MKSSNANRNPVTLEKLFPKLWPRVYAIVRDGGFAEWEPSTARPGQGPRDRVVLTPDVGHASIDHLREAVALHDRRSGCRASADLQFLTRCKNQPGAHMGRRRPAMVRLPSGARPVRAPCQSNDYGPSWNTDQGV